MHKPGLSVPVPVVSGHRQLAEECVITAVFTYPESARILGTSYPEYIVPVSLKGHRQCDHSFLALPEVRVLKPPGE
ncbi:hypothetical protein FDG2_1171 [Candidatus Protofrankia californiensis]|uniref:Uncharacterized protein n=1 Tax=Candidatus Protofrankia californiensis TaxID=1839754 RepID=A0A1C3NV42_9ACTN|nr:hypothetical protein FDG2_1171 [Candidatus Protofrankia californiensis]